MAGKREQTEHLDGRICILPQLKGINPNVLYEVGLAHIGLILLINNKEKIVFSDSLSKGSIEQETKGKSIAVYDIKEFEKYIRNESIMLDFSNCPLNFYLSLKKIARKIQNCSEMFMKKRMKKRQDEIEKMRKASKIALNALNELKDKIRGKTERDLKFKIIEYFAEQKAYEAFPTIIASGKNASFPHHMPSNKKLSKNILVDRGCSYMHYCSDLTDVINVESRAAKEDYESIKQVFYSILDDLPNIEKANELHELYIELYKKYRLKEMPHLIGHGIGLQVHEWPIINGKSDHEIIGTTITIEPSIYKKNYGLRFERVIYIGKRKARILL
ncbi:MAG: M24 family metallopeptidase [Candidatus Anstonellales archaeon]